LFLARLRFDEDEASGVLIHLPDGFGHLLRHNDLPSFVFQGFFEPEKSVQSLLAVMKRNPR